MHSQDNRIQAAKQAIVAANRQIEHSKREILALPPGPSPFGEEITRLNNRLRETHQDLIGEWSTISREAEAVLSEHLATA